MGEVRVTGGVLTGRKVTVPTRSGARYTSSKVRGAIFNTIGDVEGYEVLDLYAGSGLFSIEALSRGARHVVCVEKSRPMTGVINENVKRLGLDKDCLVLNMDVIYALPVLARKGGAYDLIFMDPPYDMGYVSMTLDLLREHPICGDNAVVVVEHSKREQVIGLRDWNNVRSKLYGDTVVSFISCAAEPHSRSGA